MKNLYYISYERKIYTHMGVDHFQLYLDSFYGFAKSLSKFHDLKFLRSCYGSYKNIVLYREAEDGTRVILRKA